jgi:hypothetical protein
MCYEFWRSETTRAKEEAARQRAQELIDKAKAAKPARPAAPADAPAVAESEKETVPA